MPRQYRTVALLVSLAMASAGALGALRHFAAPSADAVALSPAVEWAVSASQGIAAWLAAVVLLLSAAGCSLILSIRRHRIDDYRGRYRIWLAAAAACLLLSLNSVAGLHQVVAAVLAGATGWTALRDGAVWWLAIGVLPLSWVFIRTLLDAKECRLAAALLAAAAMSYVAGAAAYFGALSTVAPHLETILSSGAAELLGHWLLLAAVVSYARFVVLDAQGLVPVRPRIKHPRKERSVSVDAASGKTNLPRIAAATALSTGDSRQRPANDLPPAKPVKPGEWVDGSRPERDRYDDDGDDGSPTAGRKLSKADRKRLRKLKAQNRAA